MTKPKYKEITQYFDIGNLNGTLNEILYAVQQLILEHGDDSVVKHYGYGAWWEEEHDIGCYLITTRLETDEEYEKRLMKQKKTSEKRKVAAAKKAETEALKKMEEEKRERLLYEQLKRKFEMDLPPMPSEGPPKKGSPEWYALYCPWCDFLLDYCKCALKEGD